MDKIIKIIAGLFAVIVIASLAFFLVGSSPQAGPSTPPSVIYYFWGDGCPHCEHIKPFIDNLTQKYPDADIQVLEVWKNQTNQVIYAQANAAAGVTNYGVPEVIYGNVVLMGENEIPAKMEALVKDYLKKKH
jgi:thiol-disulfide isomerase/thioredoxin